MYNPEFDQLAKQVNKLDTNTQLLLIEYIA